MALFNNKQFVFLVVGASLTGYWLYKKTGAVANALNPFNRNNVINTAFNEGILELTGFDIGNWTANSHDLDKSMYTSRMFLYVLLLNLSVNNTFLNLKSADLLGKMTRRELQDYYDEVLDVVAVDYPDLRIQIAESGLGLKSLQKAMKMWNENGTVWWRSGDHWTDEQIERGQMM